MILLAFVVMFQNTATFKQKALLREESHEFHLLQFSLCLNGYFSSDGLLMRNSQQYFKEVGRDKWNLNVDVLL